MVGWTLRIRSNAWCRNLDTCSRFRLGSQLLQDEKHKLDTMILTAPGYLEEMQAGVSLDRNKLGARELRLLMWVEILALSMDLQGKNREKRRSENVPCD